MAQFPLGLGASMAAGGTAVVAGGAFLVYTTLRDPAPAPVAPAAQIETQVALEPEPVVDQIAEAEPAPQALAAPSFDVVNVEDDGQTLVAGQAAAGELVEIILDQDVAGQATADGSGRFVAFLSIPPADDARTMGLVADPKGEARASEQTIIITPFSGQPPVALAQAPEPAQDDPAPLGAEPEILDVVAEAAPSVDPAAAEIAEVAQTEPAVQKDLDVAVVDQEAAQVDAPVAPPETEIASAAEEVAGQALPPQDAPVIIADPIVTPEPTELDTVETTPPQIVASAAPEAPEPESPITASPGLTETVDASVATKSVVLAEPAAQANAIAVEGAGDRPVAAESLPPADTVLADTDIADQQTPAEPAVLMADASGLRVLQSPTALTSVALDTISYDQAGQVSLGGRGTQDGFVRVYLDDQPITASRIQSDGSWRTALPQVDTGVYQLRVDQVDSTGKVRSRVETPFKREEPELVAALQTQQTTTGPLQNQTALTVQPGATLWAIARETYGEGTLYVKVFEANKERIRDPNLIYPGQVFDLPE